MTDMTNGQLTVWVAKHDERHELLRALYVDREVYNRDLAELRGDMAQLQSTLSKAVWAIVSLVVAVLANLIAIWGGQI